MKLLNMKPHKGNKMSIFRPSVRVGCLVVVVVVVVVVASNNFPVTVIKVNRSRQVQCDSTLIECW
jgi:cell division septal protein FtsQ